MLSSGQIVPEEYVDTDTLLRGDDSETIRARFQHANGAAHLMPCILVEHGIKHAFPQRIGRVFGELMGDDGWRPFAR
ncbi:hypothetical protein QE433_000371 [Agrobacterium tumefaciens]|nr:hypothetical protein [Agrobacterium tumefaciens]